MSSSATSGRRLQGRRDHLVAAADVRDDLEVRLQREQRRERTADHRLVLGDQHADHEAAPAVGARRPHVRGHGDPQPPPAPGERPGLDGPAEGRRALAQAREARPRPATRTGRRRHRRRSRGRRPRPARRSSPVRDDADLRRRRLAVAQDVRDALADRPAEQRRRRPRGRPSGAGSTSPSIPAAASAERAPASSIASVGWRYPLTVSRTDASASRATRSTSAISAAARSGSSARTRRASSLLSAITDRLCPSVSWRSRAIRVRSSATASSARSRRAAWSSRFARPRRARANSVSEIVAAVTPTTSAGAPVGRRVTDREERRDARRRRSRRRRGARPRAGRPSRRHRSRAPSPAPRRTRPAR